MQQPFWNTHYQKFDMQQPSSFSQYCARYLRDSDVLLELGCGNGRDGLALSSHVAQYIGVDACGVAIDAFSKVAATGGPRTPRLMQGDFTSLDFNQFCEPPARLVIYSRFSLHSITYEEQERLLANLRQIHRAPWMLLLEARTIYDDLYGVGRSVGLHEYETDHYRRFIDPTVFLRSIAPNYSIAYFEVAPGFAVYKNENPVLLRAVILGDDGKIRHPLARAL